MSQQPVLKISPHTIEFPLVLFQSLTSKLHLENIHETPVAFKIKTTAPKNYLVRPSAGVIGKEKSVDVEIILQPLTAQPPLTTADRFLVQATPVESDASNPSKEFWTNVSKHDIWDQRLTVVFKSDADGPSEADVAGRSTDISGQPFCFTSTCRSQVEESKAPADRAEGNAPAPSYMNDVMAKYEDLKQSYLSLESEKLALRQENERLRQQMAESQSAAHPGPAPAMETLLSSMRFEIWHWIPVILLVLLTLKFLGVF